MRVHVVGGFLGAGKTTALRALAALLAERGERVAIITNDQGHALVDTALCRDAAPHVEEIGGGCFCCRYDELDRALANAASSGATVALAEAVGSCTDLVATVLSPLADREAGRYRLAPLSVLVDPWRAAEVAAGAFPDDVAYLFRKQIEEADVVVLTRADLDPPDVEPQVRAIRADVPVVRIASTTGAGVADWVATLPTQLSAPLEIDYDRYAAAEALLGWANGRVLVAPAPGASLVEARAIVSRFLTALDDAPIAHLKIHVDEPGGGASHMVRRGEAAGLDLEAIPERAERLSLLVNARVAEPPATLEARLRDAITAAAAGGVVTWPQLDCFEPGRPVPVHRYATRCDPAGEGACCAAFYQSPAVRYLLGDSFHPGGTDLTLEVADALELDGARVLDVACGRGTSLRAIHQKSPIEGVGLDMTPPEQAAPSLTFARGDAHDIPSDDQHFDAVICECALSTFADQPRALSEMLRVLRPGGQLAVSDMIANGAVPSSLAEWVHLGTCLSHARSLADYAALLEAAGFEVERRQETRWALEGLLKQIKRKLVGAALAKATGVLSDDVELDVSKGRDALREAEAVVAAGTVSYGYLIARRPLEA